MHRCRFMGEGSMTPDLLLTRDQSEVLFKAWSCNEPVPSKTQQVLICFPPGVQHRLIRVTRTNAKSTYGKPLFRVQYDPPEFMVPPLCNGG